HLQHEFIHRTRNRTIFLAQLPWPRQRPGWRPYRRLRVRVHRVAPPLLIAGLPSAWSGETAYLSTIACVLDVPLCRNEVRRATSAAGYQIGRSPRPRPEFADHERRWEAGLLGDSGIGSNGGPVGDD